MYLKSKKLKIYDVDIDYRNYLREFDDKVNLKEGRRFCGIIVSNNENDYCIPLTSRPYRPNGKRRNTRATVEIKVSGNLIGALLINNMIPVNKHIIKEVNTKTDIDKNYLINELNYLNKPHILEEIATKATKVYDNYEKSSFMKNFCCDFKLLEEKCKEWEKTHEKELDHIEQKSERNETIMESEEIKKLREYAKSKDSEIREWGAGNESTPPEVLVELAKDDDKWVRARVAENKSTPPEVLTELAKDENWTVRARVAGNESTPPEVLAELAKDEDMHCVVAGNRNISPKVLAELAKHENVNVRCAVARNESTPPEVLVELAKDESTWVRDTAKNHLAYLKSVQQGKKEVFNENRELEEAHKKERNEEIVWGKDLEGAEDFAKDLEVAQETSLDIDGADIPNNTPKERMDGLKGAIERATKTKELSQIKKIQKQERKEKDVSKKEIER